MSRAVTTNTLRLRDVYQALKSASSSANAALSRVFSATNDYIKTCKSWIDISIRVVKWV